MLTLTELKEALDAGATFIVLPNIIEEVIQYCVRNTIPVFPGGFTPNEIYNAWRLGATMVKVFPAKLLGAAYIKEIKGPFGDIDLLACGGVTHDNIKSFLSSGAGAVAFGGSIFRKDWLKEGRFSYIEKAIKELIAQSKM